MKAPVGLLGDKSPSVVRREDFDTGVEILWQV